MSQLIKQFGSSSDKIQLVCFPFAGGYSASFRPLHDALQHHCRVLAVEPPGHGTSRMTLVNNLENLVDIYVQELCPHLTEPFALFGHSMGGMVVYRLAQKLEQQGIFPAATIISAIRPPHVKFSKVSHRNDEAFLDYIIEIGGIPAELLDHKDILSYFLPAFRADFQALETFEHFDDTLLESPVHIFNGEADESCAGEALGWKRWVRRVQFHQFMGGHMFLLSETTSIAQTIQTILAAVEERGPMFQQEVAHA